MKAMIVGASGLVGSCVLEQLLTDAEISSITLLTRRSLGKIHPKIREVITDFEQLEHVSADIFTVDAVFSCLGTTLGRTGEQSMYKRIETTYPLAIAERSIAVRAKSFHYVSAVGSSSQSSLNYSKMKGETEDGLRDFQKKHPQTCIASYRPSFILGDRKEKRLIEQLAIPIWTSIEFLMQGPLKKYRSTHAHTIARSMIKQAKNHSPGFFILEYEQMLKFKVE
ncbi:MAG: hypothetical protein KA436_10950 [Oligoflexales bacterium]|nr:hypothetical protein [Oligoflexales bacterium]